MEVAIRSSYCGTVVISKFNAGSDHVMIISALLWLVGALWVHQQRLISILPVLKATVANFKYGNCKTLK